LHSVAAVADVVAAVADVVAAVAVASVQAGSKKKNVMNDCRSNAASAWLGLQSVRSGKTGHTAPTHTYYC